MATKNVYMPIDRNGKPIPTMQLNDSQDVDGSSASTQSAAIEGYLVRITSTDNALRIAIGADPTAEEDSIYIPPLGELYLPILPTQKVAVLGGIANICTCGV